MTANFTGIWQSDMSRSRLLTPNPAAMTVIIEHAGADLRQEILLRWGDGTEQSLTFRCSTDSTEHICLLNGSPVRGSARWLGNELLIETWLQISQREVHLCDYWSLSPEGNTLTMEHRGDDLAGQITVLRREAA